MKSSSTLSQIENNRQACSLDQLKQLCAVLGVPSSYVTWKSEGHHLNNLYRDQEEEIHDHMKVYESRYIGEIDDAEDLSRSYQGTLW